MACISPEEFESTSLVTAILAADTDRVRALVGIGVALSESHHWVLYQACLQGMDMLQAIVASRGVTLNEVVPDAHGDCLLHYILRTPSSRFSMDKTSIVKVLLDHGADPFSRDRHGDTSLHILAGMNSEDHALLLLFLGSGGHSQLNRRNRYNDTPLIVAVLYDHHRAARALLEHGADPHARGERGMSAMEFALQSGNSEMVDLLLVFGASLDGDSAMLVDAQSSCVDTEMDLGEADDGWYDLGVYLYIGDDEDEVTSTVVCSTV
jgi:hypothetical protein